MPRIFTCPSTHDPESLQIVKKLDTYELEIAIPTKDNLTERFIGTLLSRCCCKRAQIMEHEISQKNVGFDLLIKEARRGSSTAKIQGPDDSLCV